MMGTRVRAILRTPDRVEVRARSRDHDSDLQAPLVVGADGRFSIVARSAGLHLPRTKERRAAIHAWVEGVTGCTNLGEMHLFEDGTYLGINPLVDGSVNLSAVLGADPWQGTAREGAGEAWLRRRIESSANLWPRFGRMRLRGAVRYLSPLRVEVRDTVADGVLLVGDAGGFVDPLTGEGISQAIATAVQAARVAKDAVAFALPDRQALARYARARRREFGARYRLHRTFQRLLRWPSACNALGRRLRASSFAGDHFISVIGGVRSPRALLQPRFLWSLLRHAQ
jgi:flavin-dependent dehydrogenase